MKNSLFIARIAGIRIFIHWTFPLIFLWIIFLNLGRGTSGSEILWVMLFVLALFVCVTLHELGHATAARRYHINTRDITLLPIGGVARLENMPENPKQELVVAVAGPAVNVLIFLVLYLGLRIVNVPMDFSTLTNITASNFLLNLAVINIWLALFNLIPAFPMDGGRVLRALLALRWSRLRATQVAARIGQGLAIIFVFAGFFVNPFLIFIGLFIFLGAAAEAEQVQTGTLLKGHTIGMVTMHQYPVLAKSDTVQQAVQQLLNGQVRNFLIMDGEDPYGTLDRDAIIRALAEHGGNLPVAEIADTDLRYIDASEPVQHALLQMQEKKNRMLLVTRNDRPFGVVDMENILEYIMVINAAEGKQVRPGQLSQYGRT